MWHWAAAALILLIASALRLVGTRGDLWLDEIWTLVLLKPVTSVGQIIWGINHDNNHYLNSLYSMWWARTHPRWSSELCRSSLARPPSGQRESQPSATDG